MALLRCAIFIALAGGGCAVLIVGSAAAAPTEEDLPASPPMRHAPPRIARPIGAVRQLQLPARAESAPQAPKTPDTSAAPDPSAAAPVATPSPASAAAADSAPLGPRTYFPYTIRTGDTLEAIAALFGVQSTDIARVNRHLSNESLRVGDTIRIPNPSVTRERELSAQVERLSIDRQEADEKAAAAQSSMAALHAEIEAASAFSAQNQHDLRVLPWWRAAAWSAAVAAVLMAGITVLAVIEWLLLRWRYGALAELNTGLRRLDQKYRMLMGKAELRLQELYGRRRRGFEEGQDRPPLPEEFELDRLDRELKVILEKHLNRLGPPGKRARRARSRELISAVGAPIEARATRR
ncbi:MAG: LysM peptidoglycan-binding domain-containing protein [Candidatus Binataceae bacterium]|nr:LysM peptidoglycan-binding domain-containing protein [Candidatus Binataceae bacterium]